MWPWAILLSSLSFYILLSSLSFYILSLLHYPLPQPHLAHIVHPHCYTNLNHAVLSEGTAHPVPAVHQTLLLLQSIMDLTKVQSLQTKRTGKGALQVFVQFIILHLGYQQLSQLPVLERFHHSNNIDSHHHIASFQVPAVLSEAEIWGCLKQLTALSSWGLKYNSFMVNIAEEQ